MTSRLAPVLPSTIVTVTVPGDFAGAGGGRAAVVAGGVDSAGAAACGTAMTSGAFLAIRKSAGTAATGSPPERSSAVTAHNTNAPKNRPSATAMICAAETSIACRYRLGPGQAAPSGRSLSCAISFRLRPNPRPRAMCKYANHDSEHITAFPQRVVPLAGACRKQQKNRGGTWAAPVFSFGAI
jgi:hypothetical protein